MFSLITKRCLKFSFLSRSLFSNLFKYKLPSPILNSLVYSRNKLFSSVQVSLSQEEAMRMEEYDKIMIELKNSSITETNYHSTMLKLLDICNFMSKYAEYMEGWDYLITYFETNFEKINDQDFLRFFKVFTFLRVKGSTDDMWSGPVRNLINSRPNITNIDFLNNIIDLSVIDHFMESKELIDQVIVKILDMNLSNMEEVINAVCFLSVIKLDKTHSLWLDLNEKLSHNFKFYEKNKQIDFITAATALSYAVGNQIEGYTEHIETLRKAYFEQINRFNVMTIIEVSNKLVECGKINEDEFISVLKIISSSAKNLHPLMDARLKLSILIFCVNHPNIHNSLSQNKISNFSAPSGQIVEIFEREYNEAKGKGFNNVINFLRDFESSLNDEIKNTNFLNYEEAKKFRVDI